jgi:L-aspartate oxidase
VHHADATGKALSLSLINKAKQHPNITLLEHHNAIDLITADKLGLKQQRVLGAYVLDTHSKQVKTITANIVALATGGANKVTVLLDLMVDSSSNNIARCKFGSGIVVLHKC